MKGYDEDEDNLQDERDEWRARAEKAEGLLELQSRIAINAHVAKEKAEADLNHHQGVWMKRGAELVQERDALRAELAGARKQERVAWAMLTDPKCMQGQPKSALAAVAQAVNVYLGNYEAADYARRLRLAHEEKEKAGAELAAVRGGVWISVKERNPERPGWFIVEDDDGEACPAWWDNGKRWEYASGESFTPIRWMPLPTPPASAGDGRGESKDREHA